MTSKASSVYLATYFDVLRAIATGMLLYFQDLCAQAIKLDNDKLLLNQVSLAFGRVMGKEALKVDSSTFCAVDEPTLTV